MLKIMKMKTYNKLLNKLRRYEGLARAEIRLNEDLLDEMVDLERENEELKHKMEVLEQEYEQLRKEHEKQRRELFVKNRMLSYVKTLRRLGK